MRWRKRTSSNVPKMREMACLLSLTVSDARLVRHARLNLLNVRRVGKRQKATTWLCAAQSWPTDRQRCGRFMQQQYALAKIAVAARVRRPGRSALSEVTTQRWNPSRRRLLSEMFVDVEASQGVPHGGLRGGNLANIRKALHLSRAWKRC